MLPLHRRNRHRDASPARAIDNGAKSSSFPPSPELHKAPRSIRSRKRSMPTMPWGFFWGSSRLSSLDRARRRRFLNRMRKNPNFVAAIVLGASGLVLLLLVGMEASLPSFEIYYSGSSSPTTPISLEDSQHQRQDTLRKHPSKSPIADDNGIIHQDNNLFGKGITLHQKSSVSLLIQRFASTAVRQVALPKQRIRREDHYEADFGGLNIHFYDEPVDHRIILQDLEQRKNHFRPPDVEVDDDVDYYYYFDDDELRSLRNNYDSNSIHDPDVLCRRVSDHHLLFPNCNDFHEVDRINPQTNITYLAAGAYRQVFAVSNVVPKATETIAIKDILYSSSFLYDDFEYVRMDAIVAERLTASPRIYDIYGHCGLGIMSEYFYHGDIEKDFVYDEGSGYIDPEDLHDKNEVKPQNNLTGIEKLVLSLEMAEALADLHGFSNALIVHDDVQMSQFLFNEDKTRLKLNDFNRAEMPLFDEEHHQYCRYKNGRGSGNWRAPEEYKDEPLTEQIDVWSLGNNMYALLTGLNPLYDIESDERFIRKILEGKIAYIDPRYESRSPGEDSLAKIILKCFVFDAEDRPTIFEIVDLLSVAVSAALEPGTTRQTVLQGIHTAETHLE